MGSTQHACSPAFIVILLNVGRVQRPTLKMLVDREAAITGFRKEPYYHVHLSLDSAEAISGRCRSEKDKGSL